ncbi:MAG: hypothetical protein ACTSRG_00560 [Candidatus Helarchaeota archaeon]
MNRKIEDLRIAANLFKNNNYIHAAKCYANAAELLEKSGNYEEAEKIFDNIIECYEKEAEMNIRNKNFHEAAENYLAAGELQNRLDQKEISRKYYKKAVQQYMKAAEKALEQKDFQTAGDYFKKSALHSEADIYDKMLATENYNNAIECYQKFIEQVIKTNDIKNAAQFIQLTAILYERIENFENAIAQDERALKLAKKKGFMQIITDSHLHIAECYVKQNKIDEMINTLRIAKKYNIEVAKKKKIDKKYLESAESFDYAILILEELIKLFPNNESYPKELKELYVSKAEMYSKIAEDNLEKDEIERAAHFQRNTALSLRMVSKHEEAAKFFISAGENFEKINNKKLASQNFRDAGIQFEIINRLQDAAELLKKAAELIRSEGPAEASLECYRASLKNYKYLELQGQFKEILEEFEAILKVLVIEEEKEENYHVSASYLFEIGNYYDYLNKEVAKKYFQDAIIKLQKAIELAIQDEQLTIAAYSLNCFIVINLILNDLKNAKSNLDKYRKLLGEMNYFKFGDELVSSFSSQDKKISEISKKYSKILKYSEELNFLFSKLIENIETV